MFTYVNTNSLSTLIFFIVDLLTTLFVNGENTFKINDDNKIIDVKVTRQPFHLTDSAKEQFVKMHDDWEINICKKYHYDTLISGKFSKSIHIFSYDNFVYP